MTARDAYKIVCLQNGTTSVRSIEAEETFHPGIGPAAEAEALYVRQICLPQRVQDTEGEFVLWDVGLGAAANALTAIRLIQEQLADSGGANPESHASKGKSGNARNRWGEATDERAREDARPTKVNKPGNKPKKLRVFSFDLTRDALSFALRNSAELAYLDGYEQILQELVQTRHVTFGDEVLRVEWSLALGDFTKFLSAKPGSAEESVARHTPQEADEARSRRREEAGPGDDARIRLLTSAATPHAILFDPHSPKKNPTMWTTTLFTDLFRCLDPERPCSLATYTRSTMVRVTMLLAGFSVGVGHASGLKEETTVAANRRELLNEPLDLKWLERLKRSGGAEPLREPVYRQAPLSPETWETLRRHPQFS